MTERKRKYTKKEETFLAYLEDVYDLVDEEGGDFYIAVEQFFHAAEHLKNSGDLETTTWYKIKDVMNNTERIRMVMSKFMESIDDTFEFVEEGLY